MCSTNRIALVFDFSVREHLGMLSRHEVIEILDVVNGTDGVAQASRLARVLRGRGLEGADNQPIAQEQLLVESSYKVLAMTVQPHFR